MASRVSKKLYFVASIIICYNVVFILLCSKLLISQKYELQVTEMPYGTRTYIPDDFIGVGVDASQFANDNVLNFTNNRLQELTAALAPARLRLGGTLSERLIFANDMTASTCDSCRRRHSNFACTAVRNVCRSKVLPFFLFTINTWKSVNEFCEATGVRLMFSVNAMLRHPNNTWDDHNARHLLTVTKAMNYSLDFQLGNEPNSFPHNFNVTVTPQALAQDFATFRKLLDHYGFQDSLLVGPDTTRPQEHRPECLEYMEQFLAQGRRYIDARAWHQYYLNSRMATLEDFWSPNTSRMLEQQIATMKKHTGQYKDIPMWLTETSSSYGGGTPGISDSYGASALWIDKLGLAAKNNITTVIRQSLFGGNYSLLDENMKPLPDYWITVLFKRLVGNKVLHVSCADCNEYTRLYAHCAKDHTNDAITIYGVNMQHSLVKIQLKHMTEEGMKPMVDEYVISPPHNDRLTKHVMINGFQLDNFKDLKPKKLAHVRVVHMPPYSIVFWVVKNTTLQLCK